LGGFQSARIEKAEILKVLHAINASSGAGALKADRLDAIFSKWWGDFQDGIAAWKEPAGTVAGTSIDRSSVPAAIEKLQMQIGDLIQLNQELSRTVSSPDRILPPTYLRSLFASDKISSGRYRDTLRRVIMRIDEFSYIIRREMGSADKFDAGAIQRLLRSLEADLYYLRDSFEMPMRFGSKGVRYKSLALKDTRTSSEKSGVGESSPVSTKAPDRDPPNE
jgi:hypothetical protein